MAQPIPQNASINYELLLTRIKKIVLNGTYKSSHLKILENPDIWSKLTPQQMLEWARLCEIIGNKDLVLTILTYLNHNYSNFTKAWKEHFEYLMTIGNKKEAAKIRAKAILYNPDLEQQLRTPKSLSQPTEDADITLPFEQERYKNELLSLYYALFQGRENCFARQWADKKEGKSGYVPVRRPLTIEDIKEHLFGYKTYGIYILMSDSKIKLAVIDMDLTLEIRKKVKLTSKEKELFLREKSYTFTRIKELSKDIGLSPLIEFSGSKGYHFWYFFKEPVPAKYIRNIFNPLINSLNKDLSLFHLELFPKQDTLQGKGYGNLVKLPLGLHRLSGKKSFFLKQKDKDIWKQLEVLKEIIPVAIKDLKQTTSTTSQSLIMHPREKEWAQKYPELHLLSNKCVALSQIISICRENKELSLREEKILYGTIGFLKRSRTLIHYLLKNSPGYNLHLVDYKISKLRGSPIGCKKIHSLLSLNIDFCEFKKYAPYITPILHCPDFVPDDGIKKFEKIENLQQALEHLMVSIDIVKKFLPGV